MRRLVSLLALSMFCLTVACSDDDPQTTTSSSSTGGTATTGGMGGAPTTTTGGMGGTPSTGGAGGMGGSGGAAGMLPFELTSPAYMDGEMMPDEHSCDGVNISPQLDWTPGPPGTMSYALTFRDASIDYLHSVTWDIPASTFSLPEDVDKDYEPADVPGAKQANSYAGNRGYAGPCSPNSINTYVFTLHAMPTANLALDQNSSRQDAADLIEQNSIESTTLTGLH
jgi:Raf kinase inhibitor-like YbhB/YbcL family protein